LMIGDEITFSVLSVEGSHQSWHQRTTKRRRVSGGDLQADSTGTETAR
jgi:hypothetical protein